MTSNVTESVEMANSIVPMDPASKHFMFFLKHPEVLHMPHEFVNAEINVNAKISAPTSKAIQMPVVTNVRNPPANSIATITADIMPKTAPVRPHPVQMQLLSFVFIFINSR